EFISTRIPAHEVREHFDARQEEVHVHGHCHAKAMTGIDPVLNMLSLAGYAPVDMKTGCCGMAGSFGYEEDHYRVSMDIGRLKLFPAIEALPGNTAICAHGFSCRHQISDGTGRQSRHPAGWMLDAMVL
ncbi:MAG: FAD-binding oxidoreductase, partial [Balneolales bacterium]